MAKSLTKSSKHGPVEQTVHSLDTECFLQLHKITAFLFVSSARPLALICTMSKAYRCFRLAVFTITECTTYREQCVKTAFTQTNCMYASISHIRKQKHTQKRLLLKLRKQTLHVISCFYSKFITFISIYGIRLAVLVIIIRLKVPNA